MKLNSELYDGIETIEFKITDRNKNQYFFPDIPRLKNKLIRRIEANMNSFTPNSYLPPTSPANFFMTLVSKGIEVIKNFPLSSLRTDPTYTHKTEIFNHFFDFGKSYIFISDTTIFVPTLPGEFWGFTISVYYQDPAKNRFTTELPPFKIDYVEAKVNSTSETVFKISGFKNVQNKKILAISFFNPEGITSYTPDGREIVSTYVLADGSYLTLWDTKEEIIKDIPIYRLSNTYPLHSKIFFRAIKIDWPKSYVKVGYTGNLVLGTVFYLPVFYID
jgi:hypothetical protein